MKGVCIITHGSSNANAIKNAIRVAAEFAEGQVNETIARELTGLHASYRCNSLGPDSNYEHISPSPFSFPDKAPNPSAWAKNWPRTIPVARETFEEADEALRYKISQLCFEGPEEKLKLTEITQPAILTVSVAAFRVLSERGPKPDFVAGHSLGEYSAHVAAGTLKFADAVRAVRNRGQYMQEAVPVGVGAMAAILGLDAERSH